MNAAQPKILYDSSMEQPGRPLDIAATPVRCVKCGYDLTGATIGALCPECGAPVNASYLSTGLRTSGYAIASLVLGIVAAVTGTLGCLCLGPLLSVPCGVVGLFMYRAASREIKAGLVNPGSSSMNIAGLICSIVGLAMGTIFLGFMVIGILQDL